MAKGIPAADRAVETTDNEDPAFALPVIGNTVSGKQLRSFIERIERLQAEIQTLREDVTEVKKEAKGTGFEVAVINHLIKIRRQDADDLAEFEVLVDTYKRAIGMAL